MHLVVENRKQRIDSVDGVIFETSSAGRETMLTSQTGIEVLTRILYLNKTSKCQLKALCQGLDGERPIDNFTAVLSHAPES